MAGYKPDDDLIVSVDRLAFRMRNGVSTAKMARWETVEGSLPKKRSSELVGAAEDGYLVGESSNL